MLLPWRAPCEGSVECSVEYSVECDVKMAAMPVPLVEGQALVSSKMLEETAFASVPPFPSMRGVA